MVNFDGLFNAAKMAIRSTASMQESTEWVDTEQEKDSLKVILSGVNKAAAANMDTVEVNKLVNKEKAELIHFVDDAEILADLMGALAASNDPDLDMAKIEKYNKEHPTLSDDATVAQTIMQDKDGYLGMDVESFNVIEEALGENAGQVFRYMSDAIKSGSATRISNNQYAFQNDIDGAERIMDALKKDETIA